MFLMGGVYNSLRPRSYLDTKQERDGGSIEGLVAQHVKAWTDAQVDFCSLHFWRSANKREVDFILYGANFLLAFEVKNGTVVHPSDLRGLEVFKEDYPEQSSFFSIEAN